MIIAPFSLGKHYLYDQESKEFLTYANEEFKEGSFEIVLEDKDKTKNKTTVTVEGNKISTELPNTELETVQKVYDGILKYVKKKKIKRFRGFVSLKKHGILFSIEYMPEDEEIVE